MRFTSLAIEEWNGSNTALLFDGQLSTVRLLSETEMSALPILEPTNITGLAASITPGTKHNIMFRVRELGHMDNKRGGLTVECHLDASVHMPLVLFQSVFEFPWSLGTKVLVKGAIRNTTESWNIYPNTHIEEIADDADPGAEE